VKRYKKGITRILLIYGLLQNYLVNFIRVDNYTRNSTRFTIAMYCEVPHSKSIQTRVNNHTQLLQSWQSQYNIRTFEVGKNSKLQVGELMSINSKN